MVRPRCVRYFLYGIRKCTTESQVCLHFLCLKPTHHAHTHVVSGFHLLYTVYSCTVVLSWRNMIVVPSSLGRNHAYFQNICTLETEPRRRTRCPRLLCAEPRGRLPPLRRSLRNALPYVCWTACFGERWDDPL